MTTKPATKKPPAKAAKPAVDQAEPDAAAPVAAKQDPFRPSGIPPQADRVTQSNPSGDSAKWLREHGKPNPVRLYHVTAVGGGKDSKALRGLEINGVDETAVINLFTTAHKIKEPHRYKFRAVMLKG